MWCVKTVPYRILFSYRRYNYILSLIILRYYTDFVLFKYAIEMNDKIVERKRVNCKHIRSNITYDTDTKVNGR